MSASSLLLTTVLTGSLANEKHIAANARLTVTLDGLHQLF